MIHEVFQATFKEVDEKKQEREAEMSSGLIVFSCVLTRVEKRVEEQSASMLTVWAGNSATYPLAKKCLRNIFQMI